jgi:hypothetical protein
MGHEEHAIGMRENGPSRGFFNLAAVAVFGQGNLSRLMKLRRTLKMA